MAAIRAAMGPADRSADGSDGTAPYDQLYIYYLEGRLRGTPPAFGEGFIGNWEEENTSFLFFSAPADEKVEGLLAQQPHLILADRFAMPYDQWHGDPVEPFAAARFLIMPPWRRVAAAVGEIPVLLDPGVVFGAGTHPTTRDCLEAVEFLCNTEYVASSLDLGTGTGLLAIAAARLGCRRNLAVDLNFLAAKTADRNVTLNHLEDHVFVWCGSAFDYLDLSADLLIANIHYDVMKHLIIRPAFLQKKWFILSGLLRSEAATVEASLSRQPVVIMEKWVQNGIWHTFLGRVI